MIYIVIDGSHEWGQPAINFIEFVGTDKDKALQFFDDKHSAPIEDSHVWHHQYSLWKYPENYDIYEVTESKNPDVPMRKLIKNISNNFKDR